MSEAPEIVNDTLLDAFGVTMFNNFQTYQTDRRSAEDQWLKNMRQWRGIYDPEILSAIPANCSKAYPRMTRWKGVAMIARLMQMLFPQTEENFQVNASPLPNISTEQLQTVLTRLQTEKAEAEGIPAEQVELSTEEIEKAIQEFAAQKAERMQLKIVDDLKQMDYITLARKVVKSACMYNVGVLKGPMHTQYKTRTWAKDANTGQYVAKEEVAYRPLYEFLPVWSWYPDMTAVTLDKQDGTYERHVMTRAQVQALADRPDFLAHRVTRWLAQNPTGNYKPLWWESVIKGEKASDRNGVSSRESRKYVAVAYHGDTTGMMLKAAGVSVSDDQLGEVFTADVWMLDQTVIKCQLAPLAEKARQYHEFVFEEDDLSLLGNSIADVLRDSQLGLCDTERAMYDNMSVIGPMAEVNQDLLTPGQDVEIRKHKTWLREGEGAAASYPAVRDISIASHLSELLPMRQAILETADKESGLPPASMGDVTGGGSEALRTQGNASMFLGAAALPIRDTVRNFDTFTTSMTTALVAWNKKYAPNDSRDGDFDIIGRGSTSLIAKEVLGASLDAVRQTVTPSEEPYLRVGKLLKARLKARDVPTDEILEDDDVAQRKIQQQAEQAQAQAQAQAQLTAAQVQELVTQAVANLAKAAKDDASTEIGAVTALTNAAKAGADANLKQQALDKPAAKPATKKGKK